LTATKKIQPDKWSATRREKAAEIIVEAATLGDPATIKKHGIDERTLFRYREALPWSPVLSALVAEKRSKVEAGWADEIPGAMREAIAFLRRAATDGDHKDAAMVHSVAGAFKLLSEQAATWKVLDARLARQNRPLQPEAGSATAAPSPAPGRTLGLVAGNGSH
jgi:hypothetical protein